MVTDACYQPPAGDWREGSAAVAVLSPGSSSFSLEATFFGPGVTAER